MVIFYLLKLLIWQIFSTFLPPILPLCLNEVTMDPNYGYVQSAPQNTDFLKTIIIIASLAVAIIIAIVLLISSSQNVTGVQSQRLIVRYDNLQTLLSDTETTRNLKNQDLSNIVKA